MRSAVFLLFFGLCAFNIEADEAIQKNDPQDFQSSYELSAGRKNGWIYSFQGLRYSLKAGDGHEILGNAWGIGLGRSYIDSQWFILGQVDVYLGPHEPAQERQLNVDHFGTGLGVTWGYSASQFDMRSEMGGYGFLLGLSYKDLVGYSLGVNRRERAQPTEVEFKNTNLDQVNEYSIRINTLDLSPGVFFSWLKPARPHGNTPDLLATRLEGVIMQIAINMPLWARYQADYNLRCEKRKAELGEKAIYEQCLSQEELESNEAEPVFETEITPLPHEDRGHLKGFSLLLSITAVLGV